MLQRKRGISSNFSFGVKWQLVSSVFQFIDNVHIKNFSNLCNRKIIVAGQWQVVF
jgi:hypothetical protein